MNDLTQKDYKRMKKDVGVLSAVGVGYYDTIWYELPRDVLLDAMIEVASMGWVSPSMNRYELQNILVTESIKAMSYQEFKDVAPHLFSYPREKREEITLVRPVEISRAYFEELQSKADKLFNLEQQVLPEQRLANKIEELETDRLPNGDQVIGVDLDQEELLLLRQPDRTYFDEKDLIRPGVITDYRSPLVDEAQVLEYLRQLDNPFLNRILYEDIINRLNREGQIDFYSDGVIAVLAADGSLLTEADVREMGDIRGAYELGQRSDHFTQLYPDYESYVTSVFVDQYEAEAGISPYMFARETLESNLSGFNQELYQVQKELLLATDGECTVAYLRDRTTETSEEVTAYLEGQLLSYYAGSLAEVAVIPFSALDQEKGYSGKGEVSNPIALSALGKEPLSSIKAQVESLQRFQTPEEALKKNQDKSIQPEVNTPKL